LFLIYNISYTVLGKFLSTTDKRHIVYKKAPHIRKALAEALNIPFDDLWGKKGKQILDVLINEELDRIKQKQLKERKRIFIGSKHHWSFIRFIRNLIYLGRPGIYLKTYKHEEGIQRGQVLFLAFYTIGKYIPYFFLLLGQALLKLDFSCRQILRSEPDMRCGWRSEGMCLLLA
jgi:hypothetical protein